MCWCLFFTCGILAHSCVYKRALIPRYMNNDCVAVDSVKSGQQRVSFQRKASAARVTLSSSPLRCRSGSTTGTCAAAPSPRKALTSLNAAGKKVASRSHPKAANRHQCPHCDKLLDTKYKLERHVRTHTGEKPFKCEACPARFNQKSSLKTHSTIHAKAVLRDPSTTKATIEGYTVNGHNFEALGIPYAGFVYDAIHKQRSSAQA